MNAYKGFTEAQAKAHRKYMEGVATIQIRMTEEKREEIKKHAADMGESVNAFLNRAADQTMERDKISEDPFGADPVQGAKNVPDRSQRKLLT